jgi:CheY-like chemotaxis protein
MSGDVVLVAEDDPDISELVGEVVESHGYSVIHAADGHAALELARRTCPALAILDIRMPRVDGLEVARALKEDASTARIPVLILTASVGGGRGHAALEAGADAYLEKPFQLERLRETVLLLLSRGRSA